MGRASFMLSEPIPSTASAKIVNLTPGTSYTWERGDSWNMSNWATSFCYFQKNSYTRSTYRCTLSLICYQRMCWDQIHPIPLIVLCYQRMCCSDRNSTRRPEICDWYHRIRTSRQVFVSILPKENGFHCNGQTATSIRTLHGSEIHKGVHVDRGHATTCWWIHHINNYRR